MKKVKVGLFDTDGVLRAKYLAHDKFEASKISGFGFCDVVFGWDVMDSLYDNTSYTGWHSGYPDAIAVPDLATGRAIPWEHDSEFYLLDLIEADGSPVDIAPRNVLKRVIATSVGQGYSPVFGAEFEFYVYNETAQSLSNKQFQNLTHLSPGMYGYSAIRLGQHRILLEEILEKVSAFGIEIEGLHTETGPGVYEVALSPKPALLAADNAALFKSVIKEIASQHGLSATFMAKVKANLPGAGGHLHQSIWDLSAKQNLFSDSKIRDSYVAGLLHHLPQMMPLYCPTVNSYKRLRDGTWAPINATWGHQNRTTAVRVISGKQELARVELRVTGADINPYLAIAGSLSSGLDGIENGLELQAETSNAYQLQGLELPNTLAAATATFRQSVFARKAFGPRFVEHFAATRDWEWNQFAKAVTDWEIERYFESI